MIRSYLVFLCVCAVACWANAISLQPQEGSLSERGAIEHAERAHELQELKSERSLYNDAGAARDLYPNLVRNLHGSSSKSELKTSNDYVHRLMLRKGGQVKPGVTPFVKIRGPFDSGTNFLHQLLKKNGIIEHSADYGQEENKTDLGGWKHWPLQWEPDDMHGPDRFRILVARHPLSWFLSNENTPYDIKCHDFRGSSTCNFELYHILDKCSNPVIRNKLHGRGYVKFNNIMEIWNMYYKGYLETEYPSLIVRYEDLLADPAAVVARIAQETGQAIDNSTVQNFEDHAKNIGRNFEEAKEYNLKKMYLAKYEIAEIPIILKYIDQDVLAQLGYTISMTEIESAIKMSQLEQQAAEKRAEEAKAWAKQQEKAVTEAEGKVAEEKVVQNTEVKEENSAEATAEQTVDDAQQKAQRRAQQKLEVQKQAEEARAEKRKKEDEAMKAAIEEQKKSAERQRRSAEVFQNRENRAAHRYRSKAIQGAAGKIDSKEKATVGNSAQAAKEAEAARIAEDDMEAKEAQAAAVAAREGTEVAEARIAEDDMETKEAAQVASTAAMEAKEHADKIAEDERKAEAAAAEEAVIAAKVAEDAKNAKTKAAAWQAKQAEATLKWQEARDEQIASNGAKVQASISQSNEVMTQQLTDTMTTVKKMKAAQQAATEKVIAEAVAAEQQAATEKVIAEAVAAKANIAILKSKQERVQQNFNARQKTEDLIAEKKAKRKAALHAAAEAAIARKNAPRSH